MEKLTDRVLHGAFIEGLLVVLFFNKGTAIPKCKILEYDDVAILARHGDNGEVVQLFFRDAISSIEFPPGWLPLGHRNDQDKT